MKISTKGRYGLRLMLCLALNFENNTRLSLKEISKKQGISEKYLEQIINPLSKAGLVLSFRGSQGGYTLAKSPKEITSGEILRTLEGSLAPVECANSGSDICPRADYCPSLTIWKKIKDAIDNVVDNITLQDILEEYKEKNVIEYTI